MDNKSFDTAVGETVRKTIMAAFGSVNAAAKISGVPYTTLDRKLNGLTSFNVSELRRIARVTGVSPGDFIPSDWTEDAA